MTWPLRHTIMRPTRRSGPLEASRWNARQRKMHKYPGKQHGLNNDTTPRYDAAAAKLAWERTVSFFNTHLRG